MKISILTGNALERDNKKTGQKAGEVPFMTKRFVIKSDTELETKGYGNAFDFNLIQPEVENIFELSDLLTELEGWSHSCIIRAKPKYGVDHDNVNRRKEEHPDKSPPCFWQNPDGVEWLMMDMDKFPVAGLNLNTNEERLEYLVSQLPNDFHDVSYHYQWSSSQGLYGWDTLSCHLWFWLKDAALDTYLDERALDENWDCDEAAFRTVQPLYTAAPVFEGCDDILKGFRSGLIRKERDEVTLSPWVKKLPPPVYYGGRFHQQDSHSKSFEDKLNDIGPRFHMQIQRAIASYVGTHKQNTDVVFLTNLMTDVISNAPEGKSNKSDYLNPAYLSRSIDGALRKFGA